MSIPLEAVHLDHDLTFKINSVGLRRSLSWSSKFEIYNVNQTAIQCIEQNILYSSLTEDKLSSYVPLNTDNIL